MISNTESGIDESLGMHRKLRLKENMVRVTESGIHETLG